MVQFPNLNSLPQRLGTLPWKYIAPVGIIVMLAVVYGALYIPQSVLGFSYSKATCINQIVFLPNNQSQSNNEDFKISYYQRISLLGVDWVAKQVCISPVAAPNPGKIQIKSWLYGGWLASNNYVVEISDPPAIETPSLESPIALSRPMTLPMENSDTIYTYIISANATSSPCKVLTLQLQCDLNQLNLEQGKKYPVVISREFAGEMVEKVLEKEVEILKAVQVKSSSITQDTIVYDKPKSITIIFDKAINSLEVELKKEGEDGSEIEST